MWKSSERVSKAERAVTGVEVRLGQLEAILDRIQARLDRIESAKTPAEDFVSLRTIVATNAEEVSERLGAQAAVINDLDAWKKEIVHAVSEGIERTDRAERRVKASIARARKSLREHGLESDALESEAHELRLYDGGGGEQGELLNVPGGVAPDGNESSSIPGVPLAALRRAHGL